MTRITIRESFHCEKRLNNEPKDYLEWMSWAEKKSKTHNQKQCNVCGYVHIWVLKKIDCSPRLKPGDS